MNDVGTRVGGSREAQKPSAQRSALILRGWKAVQRCCLVFDEQKAFLNRAGLQAVCLLHIKKHHVVEPGAYCYRSVAVLFYLDTI